MEISHTSYKVNKISFISLNDMETEKPFLPVMLDFFPLCDRDHYVTGVQFMYLKKLGWEAHPAFA